MQFVASVEELPPKGRNEITNLEVVNCPFRNATVTGITKVPNIDDPDEDTNDSNHFGEQVSKIVDLLLERRLFADLGRDGGVDVSDRGEGPS